MMGIPEDHLKPGFVSHVIQCEREYEIAQMPLTVTPKNRLMVPRLKIEETFPLLLIILL
jgi:hypothetical protein